MASEAGAARVFFVTLGILKGKVKPHLKNTRPKTAQPNLIRRETASEAGTARVLVVTLGVLKEKDKNKFNKAMALPWPGQKHTFQSGETQSNSENNDVRSGCFSLRLESL